MKLDKSRTEHTNVFHYRWTALWLVEGFLIAFGFNGAGFPHAVNLVLVQTRLLLSVSDSASMLLLLAFQIAAIDILGSNSVNQGRTDEISKPAKGLIFLACPIVLIEIVRSILYETFFFGVVEFQKLYNTTMTLGQLSVWISVFAAAVSITWLVQSRSKLGVRPFLPMLPLSL